MTKLRPARFWGPTMERAIDWARVNGVSLRQSPAAFALAMDEKLGTKHDGRAHPDVCARLWLDEIQRREEGC